jgi:Na+/phosphate symporter
MHELTHPVLREELRQICSHIEEVLRHLVEALNTSKAPFAELAQNQLGNLEGYLEKWAEESENKESTIIIQKQIKEIYDGIKCLIEQVFDKIEKKAPFSEKAMQEIEYLIGNLKYLLRCLGDVAITGNPTLVKYIIETGVSLSDSIDKFSDEHKGRVSNGVCSLKAKAIYQEIMVILKGIVQKISTAVHWLNRI